PLRAPPSLQVLAQVELAGHGVALDLSGERERQRVSDCALRETAAQLNGVAVDRAGKVARDELAAVDSLDLRAVLLERQRVLAPARGELDLDVPDAGQVRSRRLRRARLLEDMRRRQHGVETISDHLLVAGREVECRDRDSVLGTARASDQDARLRD